MVVDFPIKYDTVAAIRRRQRLRAAREVNDRQPPVTESNVRPRPQALTIRTTMGQRGVHGLQ
jgi:hypothetical protein